MHCLGFVFGNNDSELKKKIILLWINIESDRFIHVLHILEWGLHSFTCNEMITKIEHYTWFKEENIIL